VVTSPAVVEEFGGRLEALGWVSDLLVAGSLAMGDYVPSVSDLDLVALVDGSVDTARQATQIRPSYANSERAGDCPASRTRRPPASG
jgi:hypothetical protein